MTATTSEAAPRAAAGQRTRFYFWIAVAMALTAFVGFFPTFWAPLARGIPERIGVLAIHGALFYGWTLFFIYQTWLAASGGVARHRDMGLFGISLATMMVAFGGLAAIGSAQRGIAAGFATQAEAFLIVPLSALFLFAVFVFAAIYNSRNSEWHKRFMLSATAVILDAAIARLFITYVAMGGHLPPFRGNVGLAGLGAPPPPVAGVLLPALLGLLFIVAGMVYDWRTRGKVHPAYLWAGGIALVVQVLKAPISDTALWHGIARSLISLGG